MEQELKPINFNYSTKNIPIPHRNDYVKQLIFKTEKFLKNLRWRSFFFLNPEIRPNYKETYGFQTTKPPPRVPELKEFEDEMIKMIQNIKYRKANNDFQKQLRTDVKKIQEEKYIFVAADKTSNYYKMPHRTIGHTVPHLTIPGTYFTHI